MPYHYACKTGNGTIMVSHPYDEHDTCYDAYVQRMEVLVAAGQDLRAYEWRGVWGATELAAMLAGQLLGVSQYDIKPIEVENDSTADGKEVILRRTTDATFRAILVEQDSTTGAKSVFDIYEADSKEALADCLKVNLSFTPNWAKMRDE